MRLLTCLRTVAPMTELDESATVTDDRPSRRGATVGLLFFVIGTPIAVALLFLLF